MKRSTLPMFLTVVALLSVSACAELRPPHKADEANTWALVVAGEPIGDEVRGRSFRELLEDPKIGPALRQLTDELRETEGIDLLTARGQATIKEQLDILASDPKEPGQVAVQLRGIEGFSTALLLRTILFGESIEVEGHIRDYVYVYKSKSGHLAVDMTTRLFKSDVVVRKVFLHWDVEVLQGGYELHERQGSSANPDNPFPGIPDLVFPAIALNPMEEKSIWKRGLNLKLFAKGKKSIRIRNVFRQVDDGAIQRLRSDHPYYEVTAKSCVDLFVKGYPPNQTPLSTIPPKNATELFAEEADFCLGRCAHPYIVNTGGR